MSIIELDAKALKEAFISGLLNLKEHKEEVDSLNVFPVPDGDTGTNMVMTLESGTNAVKDVETERIEDLLKRFARGVLLGARGNSGVILSQFFKGLSIGAEERTTWTIPDFIAAFQKGVEKAYESVITPTEGTMLTVMREGAEAMQRSAAATWEELFALLLTEMNRSLANTPELLPVLKEAGVIDSGGAGFVYIFEGIQRALLGERISTNALGVASPRQIDLSAFDADSELEFGYCTEFILQLQNAKVDIPSFDIAEIISYLESVGNSIVAVKDDDLVKVHVHTFRPGDVLNYCQQFGEYLTLKIENMSLQHNETLIVKEREESKFAHQDVAIIACVSGRGLEQYFKEIGADVIVQGGQTSNPSAEDFVAALQKIDADTVIILPCNSNIVMAAEQAAALVKEHDPAEESGKSHPMRIEVVKAKTIAEGYSALSMIDKSQTADIIIRDMNDAIGHVATGLITTAVRDVDYPQLSVKEGDYIGLDREQVYSDSPDRLEAVKGLLEKMPEIKEKEVLAVFYGKEVDPDALEAFRNMLEQSFPWLEYGFIDGGQDVYDFILAVE